MTVTPVVLAGDVLDALPTLADASIDAVVCDPPYALGFMGHEWDTHTPQGFQAWCQAWARECLRVLRPGGHLLAFGGTRTVHRLTSGIEDAGFEIRDGIDWLYGSGFPKSLDVSKAIDKAAGIEREILETRKTQPKFARAGDGRLQPKWINKDTVDITAPTSTEAKRWAGWGTALKPARESIVVARKPLAGTVAANVQAYGTGAVNIDACRVNPGTPVRDGGGGARSARSAGIMGAAQPGNYSAAHTAGRWPTNVIMSHAGNDDTGDACADACAPGCAVAALDAQSGTLKSGGGDRGKTGRSGGLMGVDSAHTTAYSRDTDEGGASRFYPVFRYQAKAPARERPKVNGVSHSTVKPLELMRWLVRLVTPPGGRVLDPFTGSGTTVEACILEGFQITAVEKHAPYLPLIDARIARATGPTTQ